VGAGRRRDVRDRCAWTIEFRGDFGGAGAGCWGEDWGGGGGGFIFIFIFAFGFLNRRLSGFWCFLLPEMGLVVPGGEVDSKVVVGEVSRRSGCARHLV